MVSDKAKRTVRRWGSAAVALTIALTLISILLLLPRTSRPARTDNLRGEVTPTLQTRQIATGAWQLVYIGADGRLHFAALDGSVNRAGASLPAAGGFTHSVATSLDGRYAAYATQGGSGQPAQVIVLDLGAPTPKHATFVTISIHAYRVYMAPDGSQVALDTGWKGLHPIFVADTHGGSPHVVPGTDGPSGNVYNGMIGWLDATHILASALIMRPALASGDDTGTARALVSPASAAMEPPADTRSGDGAVTLVALDVTSGARRVVVQRYLGPPPLLSPDGRWLCALASGDARCIDVRNGAVRILPHIADVAGIDSSTECWGNTLPSLAVTTADGTSNQPIIQLLDIANDSALPLSTSGIPVIWSPDGRILLLSNAPPGSNAAGQAYSVSALSPVAPHGREARLASEIVTLLGIAHSM